MAVKKKKKSVRSKKKTASAANSPKKKITRRRSKKTSASRRSNTTKKVSSTFPKEIFAIASPRSRGQVSMFEPGVFADASNVSAFASDESLIERAIHLLQDSGFNVLQATSLMINFSGSRKTFESVFDIDLVLVERPVLKHGTQTESTHIDCTASEIDGLIPVQGTRFEETLEGIAIEEPQFLDAPNALAPTADYWHLRVPGDVSLGMNADKVHRSGITGSNVTVAMVDSGFESHAYFTERGYRIDPTVLGTGAVNADKDEIGHGTGEAANIFAVAPDVRLKPVKTAQTASGALLNTTAAINAAVALRPDIITNSWGGNIRFGPLSAARQATAAAIAGAVSEGITVVFSAGNGPSYGFPGQHPDVISVGGVYMHEDGSLEASNYATGFDSNIYPGRRVPDVSGLVGMMPLAAYIMLPIPASCAIDEGRAGGNHPNGDETADDDGWAAFSGTSASAPQIAGVCALMKQACPRLSPSNLRSILMSTARDVSTGTNAMGNAATVGPDNSVGNGLVDAHKAVLVAKLRCTVTPLPPIVTPREPVLPIITPRIPVPPIVTPQRPFPPIVTPQRPFPPIINPAQPLAPLRPFRPVEPGPFDENASGNVTGAGSLSAEDIALLEQMIIDSDDPTTL